MKRAAVAAVVVLATPALAYAKGPDRATICGRSGCVVVQGVDRIAPLTLARTPFELRGRAAPAPFFTVTMTSSRGDAGGMYLYVPSRGTLRVDGDYVVGAPRVWSRDQMSGAYWIDAPAPTAAALERATVDLEAFAPDARWRPAAAPASTGGIPVAAGVAALLLLALVVAVAATRKRLLPGRRRVVAGS